MPRNRSDETPPETMTWKKAMPILMVAGVFDAIRAFFEQSWFFGPAIAGAVCYAKLTASAAATGQVSAWLKSLQELAAAFGCGAAATALGVAGSATFIGFGVFMADAIGLIAFLVLGVWILRSNQRLIAANATAVLWFSGGFAVAEIPLIGTLPAFTVVLWRLYRTQIKMEGEALKVWEKAHAAKKLAARRQQAAQIMQIKAQVQQDQENDAQQYAQDVPEAA
ncbi:MAG: hypothetical protein WAW90_02060 [Minisyncoccia bacterium]